MHTNTLYAVIAVCFTVILTATIMSPKSVTNAQDVEIAKIKAQSALDLEKTSWESKTHQLDCIDRVANALGTAATHSIAGTQTEVQRICK